MTKPQSRSRFTAQLLRPVHAGEAAQCAFVVLPRSASEKLPRRGRTTVVGTLNGHDFQATLEPDGQLSHWLPIDEALFDACDLAGCESVSMEIMPVDQEPEPAVPDDLQKALSESPEAQANWVDTTTIARLDWIHWITSAKQAKTRAKRISDACSMLGSGKRRVCCFDPSGFYSKAFSAPQTAK